MIEKTFGAAYLPEQAPVYRSRGRAQEAHEAIRPTDVVNARVGATALEPRRRAAL